MGFTEVGNAGGDEREESETVMRREGTEEGFGDPHCNGWRLAVVAVAAVR